MSNRRFYAKLKMVDKRGTTETRWVNISEANHDRLAEIIFHMSVLKDEV